MTCFEEQVPMKNITDGDGAGAVRSATGLAVVQSQVGVTSLHWAAHCGQILSPFSSYDYFCCTK